MSTSDQPESRPLTRKQLREIRMTGATPVVPEGAEHGSAPVFAEPAVSEPVVSEAIVSEVVLPEVPKRDAPTTSSSDTPAAREGAAPLTRRQAREQEKLRTASVPVIAREEEPAPRDPADEDAAAVDTAVEAGEAPEAAEPSVPRAVVSPSFGESVLADASDEVPTFAPSFDDLISADSTGSQHLASNTLIFTPSPGDGSLSGPVASTGEVLITGSYELPEGIGSQGHARGVADSKDVDAVLLDGELPAASSPTPIAASSAVSTIKPAGEVIRPPVPEKGNKLMFTLAITAGGLALVLAVALIVAFTTNVF